MLLVPSILGRGTVFGSWDGGTGSSPSYLQGRQSRPFELFFLSLSLRSMNCTGATFSGFDVFHLAATYLGEEASGRLKSLWLAFVGSLGSRQLQRFASFTRFDFSLADRIPSCDTKVVSDSFVTGSMLGLRTKGVWQWRLRSGGRRIGRCGCLVEWKRFRVARLIGITSLE